MLLGFGQVCYQLPLLRSSAGGELAQWPVAAAYTPASPRPGMTGRYAGARSLCYSLARLLAVLAGTALYGLSPIVL